MKRWYVAHTHANAEQKATAHLRNQGFEVYLPVYRKQRRHARRVEQVLKPLFPRYLFVRLDLEAGPWRAVNGTIGVSCLVSHGDRPSAMPSGLVAEIKAREMTDGTVRLLPSGLDRGASIRVTAGAFCDQVGIFQEMADDKRAVLLLTLLGREVRVTAPVDALELSDSA